MYLLSDKMNPYTCCETGKGAPSVRLCESEHGPLEDLSSWLESSVVIA